MNEHSRVALLGIGILICMLVVRSALLFHRRRSAPAFFQLAGAMFMTLVVAAHLCERLRLFPSMGWGLPNSVGHYFDLASAVLGVTLFCIGTALSVVRQRTWHFDCRP
jgi:uncharacterized membrane protein